MVHRFIWISRCDQSRVDIDEVEMVLETWLVFFLSLLLMNSKLNMMSRRAAGWRVDDQFSVERLSNSVWKTFEDLNLFFWPPTTRQSPAPCDMQGALHKLCLCTSKCNLDKAKPVHVYTQKITELTSVFIFGNSEHRRKFPAKNLGGFRGKPISINFVRHKFGN